MPHQRGAGDGKNRGVRPAEGLDVVGMGKEAELGRAAGLGCGLPCVGAD